MKIIHFYHFDSDPRFPPFLLYVRWKSGVTFVRRCLRDVFYFAKYNGSNCLGTMQYLVHVPFVLFAVCDNSKTLFSVNMLVYA